MGSVRSTIVEATSSYRPDVDGLRALAVSAVIAFHAFPKTLPGGFLGVDVFFVISGYLITGLILEGVHTGRFTITGFYLRRVRRIFPALLTMLAVISLLALLVLMPDEMERFARNVTAGALFVPNLVLAREDGYFDASATTNPLLHLWSLGVEEQFYLLWPAALLLFVPRVSRRAAIVGIAAIAVASLVAHALIWRQSPNAAFYLPFTRFWQLLSGALLAASAVARAPQSGKAGEALAVPPRPPWLGNALSILGLALIAGGILSARVHTEASFALAIPATLGAVLFIAAGPTALPNRFIFSARPVVYVGLISYPLYLWHWPPLAFLHVLDADEGATGRLLRIAAVLFAVAASVLTYRLIELPLRRRRNLRPLALRLVGLLGATAAAGAVVADTGGLAERTRLQYNPFVWAPSMRLEERCADLYGQPADMREHAFCKRSDYDHDPTIVMMGDSHSNMFLPGVAAAYPNASILQIGGSACTYLRNTEFWNDNRVNWRRMCPPLVASAYRGLTPNTRVVILNARMPMYTDTPEEYARTFDYVSPAHFESPDFPGATAAETYEFALKRDVAQLLASGRQVVLVQPVPSLNFVPRSCVHVRPLDRWLPARAVESCTVPRERVAAAQATSRAIIARVSAQLADPRLHVVDPMQALCDETACHAVIDGELMYRDDNHLSVEGSKYVWNLIKPRDLAGV